MMCLVVWNEVWGEALSWWILKDWFFQRVGHFFLKHSFNFDKVCTYLGESMVSFGCNQSMRTTPLASQNNVNIVFLFPGILSAFLGLGDFGGNHTED